MCANGPHERSTVGGANDPNARGQQRVVLMIPIPLRSVLMILMRSQRAGGANDP